MVTSAERLRRLLALVPYVVSRKAVGLTETATAFGMTERELIDDLNLAWCVELKSPEPYCPIDLSYEGGEITVSQAESIGQYGSGARSSTHQTRFRSSISSRSDMPNAAAVSVSPTAFLLTT